MTPSRADASPVPTLIAVVLLLGVVGLTALLVAGHQTEAFDAAVAHALHTADGMPAGPDWLVETVRDVTALGSNAVLIAVVVIALLVLLAVRRRRTALTLLVASLLATALSSTLKVAFDRPRPDIVSGVRVFSASFPSGHATMSSAIYLLLAGVLAGLTSNRNLRLVGWGAAATFALLVGLSRIYLGVHFTTDVLAGWSLGTAWALLCGLVASNWPDRVRT